MTARMCLQTSGLAPPNPGQLKMDFRMRNTALPQKLSRWRLELVFFAAFFLYFWLRIGPQFKFHEIAPVFYWGVGFLRQFIAQPGGLLEYVAALVTHVYHNPIAGALLITLVAWLICLLTRLLFAKFSGSEVRGLHLIPGILLIILESRYGNSLTTSLGLLVALAFSLLYAGFPIRHGGIRFCVFATWLAILYYFAVGPALMFVVLCAMYEMVAGRRYALGTACLALGLALPWATARFVFVISMREAFFRSIPVLDKAKTPSGLPVLNKVASITLYVFILLAPLVMAAWERLARERPRRREKKAKSKVGLLANFRQGRLAQALPAATVLALAVVATIASFSGEEQRLVRVDYYTRHHNWEGVLKAGAKLEMGYASTIPDIVRALYHTGRLPYDMFAYPQVANFRLLYPTSGEYRTYAKLSDLFLELGCVNYAEKWAFEALEIGGERPATVRRLALICVLKGRIEAARTFLRLLARNPLHGKWANRCLADLEDDPTLAGYEEIKRVRTVMLNRDMPSRYLPADELLGSLLETDPDNQMAFEYLMAHFLFIRQPENVCKYLDCIDEFNYTRIPPLYEEAVLMHQLKTRQKVDLHGRQVSLATFKRFESFASSAREGGKDLSKSINRLARQYGDTYAFFFFYGQSMARSSAGMTGADK